MGHRCWRPFRGRYAVAASARIHFKGEEFFTGKETSVTPLVAELRGCDGRCMHGRFDRKLRSIRRSLPRTSLATLVSLFIMSKVDYCNVVLAGLSQRELDRVQSVVNAAARVSADARKYAHVTPLLMDLHWLRVPERVKFKLCVLMHRCLTGAAPRYLTELAVPVASIARRRLRSVSSC